MSYVHLFGVNIDMNFISTLAFVLLIIIFRILISIGYRKGEFEATPENMKSFFDDSRKRREDNHFYTDPVMRDFWEP